VVGCVANTGSPVAALDRDSTLTEINRAPDDRAEQNAAGYSRGLQETLRRELFFYVGGRAPISAMQRGSNMPEKLWVLIVIVCWINRCGVCRMPTFATIGFRTDEPGRNLRAVVGDGTAIRASRSAR